MTKLSKRLSDDNEKLQPLVGEFSWSENLIIMRGSKDNLEQEFHLAYRDLLKVQPIVAQIGGTHNLIVLQRCQDHLIRKLEDLNVEATVLAVAIKRNLEEVGL
jgi:hypothetical protein